jgi:putative FmdB family regulatory protein
MPMYEYQCSACEGVFEVIQRFEDPDPASCELCGAEHVQRMLSVTHASVGLVSESAVYGAGANESNVYGAPCGTCGGAPNSCQES